MISPTTKFVHEFIEKIRTSTTDISNDEKLGFEIRTFMAEYKHPFLAAFWWDDIFPNPPQLEDKYFRKVFEYAVKDINNEEFGKRVRTFTQTFWSKPGHTLLHSKLNELK
jgi:hypothetical protein